MATKKKTTTNEGAGAPPVTLTMTTRCELCGETIATTAQAWSPEHAHAMRLPGWSLSATSPDGRVRWTAVACGLCVNDKFPRLAELLDEAQAAEQEREKKRAAEEEQTRAEDERRAELRRAYGPELTRVESAIYVARTELARLYRVRAGSHVTPIGGTPEDIARDREQAETRVAALEAELDGLRRRADELRVLAHAVSGPVSVRGSHHDRPASWPAVQAPPCPFETVRSMTRAELLALGCGCWDEREGLVLLLFPGEWFDAIPDGFAVNDIFHGVRVVGRDRLDRDTRWGLLAYGVWVPR